MTAQPLAQQADAGRAAYHDREKEAASRVAVAIEEAADLYRQRRNGEAAYRMARAELSARRILGSCDE